MDEMSNYVAAGWKQDLMHIIGCCWAAQVGPLDSEEWQVAICKFLVVMRNKRAVEWTDIKELSPLQFMPYVAKQFKNITGKDLKGLSDFTGWIGLRGYYHWKLAQLGQLQARVERYPPRARVERQPPPSQGSKPASTGRGEKQTASGGPVDPPPKREGVGDSTWNDWYQRTLWGAEGERLSPKGLPIQSALHRQAGRPLAKFTTAWMAKTHPHAILPLRLCGPTILESILGP